MVLNLIKLTCFASQDLNPSDVAWEIVRNCFDLQIRDIKLATSGSVRRYGYYI